MFSQSRVKSAIARTTLVLSLVCLSAAGVLAAAKNSDVVAYDNQSQGQQTSAAAPLPTPPVGMSRATDKQSDQGRQYGQPGFVGEPINLNVVNADIRDILNYITEQYGVNFVIDASVGPIPVTVNVQDVPWNVALDAVLKANRLGIEVNGNILRVATTGLAREELQCGSDLRIAERGGERFCIRELDGTVVRGLKAVELLLRVLATLHAARRPADEGDLRPLGEMKCVNECKGGLGRILGCLAGESYARQEGSERPAAPGICTHP